MDVAFFFNSSPDFNNHYFILFFFLPFLAMPLPQLLIFFLFLYFGNGIATIGFSQFFFLPISAMPLPQFVCQIFFFPFHFGHSTHGQQNWAEEIRYHYCRNSNFSLSTFFFFSLILLVEFRQREY